VSYAPTQAGEPRSLTPLYGQRRNRSEMIWTGNDMNQSGQKSRQNRNQSLGMVNEKIHLGRCRLTQANRLPDYVRFLSNRARRFVHGKMSGEF